MARAVGYVRVSKVRGRAGDSFLSPDLQREQIAAAARREGLEVVEILEELDQSGGDRGRPLWNEAIRRVEDGEVGAVVVWNLSRFSRSVKDALDALGRIEGAGGRLVSATEQFGDDATGRMTRNILLAIAEGERDRARAGFRAAVESPSSAGCTLPGTSRTATSAGRTAQRLSLLVAYRLTPPRRKRAEVLAHSAETIAVKSSRYPGRGSRTMAWISESRSTATPH